MTKLQTASAKFLRRFIKYDETAPDVWVFRYAAQKFLTGTGLALFGAVIGFMLAYLWIGDELFGKIMVTCWLALMGNLFALTKV